MHDYNETRVIVTGKKAKLAPGGAIPLQTGNSGSFRVRFEMQPDDKVWASAALFASFIATTHVGAKIFSQPVPVDVNRIAIIPDSVLRERAVRLTVALGGNIPGCATVSTNDVNLGPVAQGAGVIFPDCGCGQAAPENCRESIWRFIQAKFVAMEPAVRRLMMLPLKALQKIGVSGDFPTWDGGAWPGYDQTHTHANKTVLDALSRTGSGGLAYGKEEIATVAALLNGLEKKLDKATATGILCEAYVAKPGGIQDMLPIAPAAEPGTLAYRGSGGTIKTAAPAANDDAATKYYVDGKTAESKPFAYVFSAQEWVDDGGEFRLSVSASTHGKGAAPYVAAKYALRDGDGAFLAANIFEVIALDGTITVTAFERMSGKIIICKGE